MTKRPRIGITMRLDLDTRRYYLGRDYGEAIEAAGGVPVHIALIPKQDYISAVMEGLDGLLLPGSDTDVDPHYYGEEPHHRLGVVIPEKDETDRLCIAEAERRSMPVLAICYGMQALNVARGGSLIQNIESQLPGSHKHEQGVPQNRSSHTIEVDDDGILAGLNAVRNTVGPIRVNSSHHQAVRQVGDGLSVSARAKDGVIECIEDTRDGRFVIGVQWHPELMSGHDDLSREIFELFVERCSNSASARIAA